MRLKPPKIQAVTAPVEPPEVLRSEEDGWTLVQETEKLAAIPDEITAHFGKPGQTCVKFVVNGQEQSVSQGQFPVNMSLAEYLRYHLGLTGTKISCGEGGCGACTVALKTGGGGEILINIMAFSL